MDKALVIDWRIPTPDRDGGSLRVISLMRALRALGYDVTFASVVPEAWPPYDATLARDTDAIRAHGITVYPGTAEACLQEQGNDTALLLFTGGVMLIYHRLATMRALAPHATIVFDTVDLSYVRLFRQAKATNNARTLARAVQTKSREFAAARAVDCTLVVSPTELLYMARECPEANVALVTDVHEVRADPPPFADRRDFFFVGTYEFNANIDAMEYYLDAIHPLTRQHLPGAHFSAIGSEPPAGLRARAADDVTITGHIPDIGPWFDRARLSIAPLRYGAGVKGKVLRSLGQGLPVVATTIAAEGLHATHGEHLLIADEPTAFAAAIATLHEDAALWARLAAGGRAVVAEHFSFTTVCNQLTAAIASTRALVR